MLQHAVILRIALLHNRLHAAADMIWRMLSFQQSKDEVSLNDPAISKSYTTGQKPIRQQTSRLLYYQTQLHALADAGIVSESGQSAAARVTAYLQHVVLPPVVLHLVTPLQCCQPGYLPGLRLGYCLASAVWYGLGWSLQLSLVVTVQQAACDAQLDLLQQVCELCLTACRCIKDCIKD